MCMYVYIYIYIYICILVGRLGATAHKPRSFVPKFHENFTIFSPEHRIGAQ